MKKRTVQNSYPIPWDKEAAERLALSLPDNIQPIELDIQDIGVEIELAEFYTPMVEAEPIEFYTPMVGIN